jgi:hypothetical protein
MPSLNPQRLQSLLKTPAVDGLEQAMRVQDSFNGSVAQALNQALVRGDTLQVLQPYTAASPLVVPSNWTALALLNSWAQYDANTACQYTKDACGNVWVQGRVKNGSAAGATVATLPAGYRPAYQQLFAVRGNAAFGSLVVRTTGNLDPVEGNTTDLCLTCSFPADAPSPYVASCFPFDVAWPQPYAPSLVVAHCEDVTNQASPSNLAACLPDWVAVQAGSQAFVRVRNLPGLLGGTSYAVTLVAL